MEIVCSKSELAKGIQTVQAAVSSKTTLPVLSNLLIETQSNQLKLAATDLEVGIRCLIKAEIVREGAITIPAKTFGDFVRTLRDNEEIKMTLLDAQKIEIRSGKTKCVLQGLPKDDFPVMPEFVEEKSFSLEAATLREMIQKTSFSASSDETRYVLNGLYFILEENTARMVATDGRRLAYIARPLKTKAPTASAIIPSKAILEVARLLSSDAQKIEMVQVSLTENQAAFKLGSTLIVSRLIEGSFPNYEQVIPKGADVKLQVATKDLLLMTQRAALGAGERGGAIRYTLEKGRLKARGMAQGRVEIEDELPVPYEGQGLEIAFNPIFVMDILKNVESSDVSLEFTTSLNPGVIKPKNDEQMTGVIMPMRI